MAETTPAPVPPAAHPSTTDGSLITPAEVAAYERGVAAGREQAAADIRAANTDGWPGSRGSDVDECQARAARIAEGNDHA